jgi:hypothetical protein
MISEQDIVQAVAIQIGLDVGALSSARSSRDRLYIGISSA